MPSPCRKYRAHHVALAGGETALHRDVAAQALDDRIVGTAFCIWPRLAEAVDRDIHDVAAHGSNCFLAEAHALDGTGAEVLHEHVRLGRELQHDFARTRLTEVEHQRALAAIDVGEQRCDAARSNNGMRVVSPPDGSILMTSAP